MRRVTAAWSLYTCAAIGSLAGGTRALRTIAATRALQTFASSGTLTTRAGALRCVGSTRALSCRSSAIPNRLALGCAISASCASTSAYASASPGTACLR